MIKVDFREMIVTIHTVSCTRCTASGQYSDGADIQSLAVTRLSNGLDVVAMSTRQGVKSNK